MCEYDPDNCLKGAAFSGLNRPLDKFCELVKQFNNRLTLRNLCLAERYANGELNILVEASWGAVNFNIVFHRDNSFELRGDSRVCHEWHPAGARAKQPDIPVWTEEHSRDTDFRLNLQGGGCYRYDAVMLVQNIKPMETPHWFIPSFACLKPKHEPLGLGAGALYFGYGTGFKSFGSLLDRQSTVLGVRLAISSNEVTGHVVKDSPEIVDGIPNESAQLNWNVFLDQNSIDVLSGMSVVR